MSEASVAVTWTGNVPVGREDEGRQGEIAGENPGIERSIQATSHNQARRKQEETRRSTTPERTREEDATDTV